jgi:hypothetical protein
MDENAFDLIGKELHSDRTITRMHMSPPWLSLLITVTQCCIHSRLDIRVSTFGSFRQKGFSALRRIKQAGLLRLRIRDSTQEGRNYARTSPLQERETEETGPFTGGVRLYEGCTKPGRV